MGKLGGAAIGGLALSPVAVLTFIIAMPVTWVRFAGCSGLVEGAYLDSAKANVYVAERVWANGDESTLYDLNRVRAYAIADGTPRPALFDRKYFDPRGVRDDVLWGARGESPAAMDLRTGADPLAGLAERPALRGGAQAFLSSTGEWIGNDDQGHVVALNLRDAKLRRLEAKPPMPDVPKVWGPNTLRCDGRCRVKDGAPQTYLAARWADLPHSGGHVPVDGAWLLLHYEKLDVENRPQGMKLSLVEPDGKERWTFAGFDPDARQLSAVLVAPGRVVLLVRERGDGGWLYALDVTGKVAWQQRL